MSDLVPLQIASAVVTLGHDLDGWSLHAQSDCELRAFEHEVAFAQPFAAPPVVHVGLAGFDVSNQDAARVRVRVTSTHAGGFTLCVETWLHTQVWGVEVSWLAVGS